jgi:hypothetical protein
MGIIIAEIKYNATPFNYSIFDLNSKLEKNYPIDLPLDVLIPLLNFPYENYLSILNNNKLSEDLIRLSFMLSTSEQDEECICNNLKIKLVQLKSTDNQINYKIDHCLINFIEDIILQHNMKLNDLKK